jgi:hypothetical protein
MPSNADLLTEAINRKSPVACYYDNHYREMCPHVIGWKNGVRNVLSYQFAGGSSRGLPVDGEWKCMDVDGITQLQLIKGSFVTGTRKTGKPETCVDSVEASV